MPLPPAVETRPATSKFATAAASSTEPFSQPAPWGRDWSRAEASELGVIELAQKFEGAGVSAIIYTDIDRDGILTGINWESTLELANAVSIPVIASGGLASIEDIRRMLQPDAARLEGAISGRALYDGRIDPNEALGLIRKQKGEAA